MFHITSRPEIEAAQKQGTYIPAAFSQEGFIHCSYLEQVVRTANRLFRDQTDLVLLEIDVNQLSCKIIDENLEGGTELFPHIYGVLPLRAIALIHDFPCDTDGQFQLPAGLADRHQADSPQSN